MKASVDLAMLVACCCSQAPFFRLQLLDRGRCGARPDSDFRILDVGALEHQHARLLPLHHGRQQDSDVLTSGT